ncbi:Hypothetical protein NTJ_12191 [Nesidiocoris tenuis]|uniref:Uncharacterized protein n=1 Tax=Nesidiocoris tenuis TaxID=355587 RepID=A0ABN7B6Z0_9HEMI|nr:Hypothetical protein NTJ_12191 [Nesidiocoris tenuis]
MTSPQERDIEVIDGMEQLRRAAGQSLKIKLKAATPTTLMTEVSIMTLRKSIRQWLPRRGCLLTPPRTPAGGPESICFMTRNLKACQFQPES